MTDEKKTEQAEQPEQAQPQEDGRPQVTTIVRTLIVQTDGNSANVVRNEMGLLELRSILQALLNNNMKGGLNLPAEPAEPPKEPDDG